MTQDEQRSRMAAYLNCSPNTPENWPMRLIDRLIRIEQEEGREKFERELSKLMVAPAPRGEKP